MTEPLHTAHWNGVSDCPLWWSKLHAVGGVRAFDVGANGGEVARMFSCHFDEVFAFEPAEESFRHLRATAPPNVAAFWIAISDHSGSVRLREAAEAIATGQLVTEDSLGWGETLGYRDVPCSTLDVAAELFGVPDLVKIDVEGHELRVLAGAKDLIAAQRTRWMIEVHAAEFWPSIERTFAGHAVSRQFHSGYAEGSAERDQHSYCFVMSPEMRRTGW